MDSEILFKWTTSCRLCLSVETDVDIFSNEVESLEILPILTSCLNILVYEGDPMPRKLCQKCWATLKEWHAFKETCTQTEQDLKKRLQLYKKIEFVQEYFNKLTKFNTKEIVPQNSKVILKIPTFEEPTSSSSKVSQDEKSNESTGSAMACVSSMSAELEKVFDDAIASVSVQKKADPPPDDKKGINLQPEATQASVSEEKKDQANNAEGKSDWSTDPEENSVGTIVSVTGSASALWGTQEKEVAESEGKADVRVKKEVVVRSCPQCLQEFPSEDHYHLHSCFTVEEDSTDQRIALQDEESSESNSLRRSSRRKTAVRRLCDEVGEEPQSAAKRMKPCPLMYKSMGYHYTDSNSELGRPKMTPWKCIPCRRYFPSMQVLSEHYESQACNSSYSDVFKCEFCSRQYTTYFELLQHQIVHIRVQFQLTDDDLVCCSLCDGQFANTARLERHSLVHSNKFLPKVTTEYPCHDCGEVYIKKELYDQHLLTHEHGGQQVFGCDECQLQFFDSDLLDIHRKTHKSTPSASTRCMRCGRMFATAAELQQHESIKHKNPTPYICRKCSFRFSIRSKLLLHLRSHLPKSDPDYCPSTEAELRALTSPAHRCQQCQAKFLYSSDLQLHAKTHKAQTHAPQVEPRPPQVRVKNSPATGPSGELLARYKCSLCPKVTVHSFSIIRHGNQVHHGEKVMAQRLKRPVPVYRHAPATGQARVKHKAKCPQCYKCFSSVSNLNVHLNTVHAVIKFHIPVNEMKTEPRDEDDEYMSAEQIPGVMEPDLKVSPNDKMEDCPFCKVPFKRSYLRQHMKRNHRGETIDPSTLDKDLVENPLVCRYCSKVCSTTYNKELHESIHMPGPGKTSPMLCPACKKIFHHKFIYDRHVKTCSVSKSFHCSVCNKLFFKFSAFQKHSCQMQGEEVVHECRVCASKFASPHLLQVHMTNSHGAQRGWQPSTSSAFQLQAPHPAKERELWQEESNKIVCKVDDKFYCTLCDCEFSTTDECRQHQTVHPRGNWYAVQIHDSLYQCTICDKFFESRKAALVHIDYHKQSTEAPPPPPPPLVSISLPGKTAGIKRSLRCPFCTSTFASEENLKNHIHYFHPDDPK